MSIMNYVQTGIVLGVVFVIQIIKDFVDKTRIKKKLPSMNKDFWVLVVLLCGIPMTLIIHGVENFVDTNVFSFVRDVFVYAAASSFAYKTYSVTKRKVTGGVK